MSVELYEYDTKYANDIKSGKHSLNEKGNKMQLSDKLADMVKYIREEINSEMPIQQLAILLEIHKSEGITMFELGRKLGITPGSMSRNISALSLYMKKGEKKGLDLVTTRPDIHQRRRLACFLTDRGISIMAEIMARIN